MNKGTTVQQFTLTGEFIKQYHSIASAAAAVGVDESSIRKALNKENRTVASYQWVTGEDSEDEPIDIKPSAKILILDIETAPIQAYVWGLWKQDIQIERIISDWFMLTWAAKFVGDDVVYSGRLNPEEALLQDDSRITESLWHLLDEADIVVAHYGDAFDLPKIRSRFLVHGLQPPSPYKQIDTKKIASREFGFSSNKLEALARLLGHEGKTGTSMSLWIDCMRGVETALFKMEEYNIQDIYVLENVYFSLRPYVKGHPNLDLYFDSEHPSCPSCGTQTLKEIEGKYFYTQAVRYKIHRCTTCGSICRDKKGDKFVNARQVSSIPR